MSVQGAYAHTAAQQTTAGDRPSARVFEPERELAGPPREFVPEDFASREIGILCEQGNFERARILLSRRAVANPEDANVYLDAIRIERSAAPSGEAWQAWVSRALEIGAQVAGHLRALLPEDALRTYLVQQNVSWSALERQKDRPAARELLRLRLEQQIADDPATALATAEHPAVYRSAELDPALRQLVIGVMAATAWRFPARVTVLAMHHGIATGSADAEALERAQGARSALAEARALQAPWAAVTQQACPQALDRFVRAGKLVSERRARALLLALSADARVQPREYLRCAEVITGVSAGLALWLAEALQTAQHELLGAAIRDGASFERGGEPAAGAQAVAAALGARADASEPSAARTALGQIVTRCAGAVRRDPLYRLWLVTLLLSAAGLGLAAVWAGPASLLYAPAALLLLPLRRGIDAILYRRNVRGALLSLVTAQGVSLPQAVSIMQDSRERPLRRLAPRARGDAALVLFSEIACAGAAPPSSSPVRADTVPA